MCVAAAWAGETAVICVDETTVKLVAATVPKRTWVVPLKPVPVMVTEVPPAAGPEVGEMALTEGVFDVVALKVQVSLRNVLAAWPPKRSSWLVAVS